MDQWFKRRCRLKEKFTDGRTDDGQRPSTIAHLEPSAKVSLNVSDVEYQFWCGVSPPDLRPRAAYEKQNVKLTNI